MEMSCIKNNFYGDLSLLQYKYGQLRQNHIQNISLNYLVSSIEQEQQYSYLKYLNHYNMRYNQQNENINPNLIDHNHPKFINAFNKSNLSNLKTNLEINQGELQKENQTNLIRSYYSAKDQYQFKSKKVENKTANQFSRATNINTQSFENHIDDRQQKNINQTINQAKGEACFLKKKKFLASESQIALRASMKLSNGSPYISNWQKNILQKEYGVLIKSDRSVQKIKRKSDISPDIEQKIRKTSIIFSKPRNKIQSGVSKSESVQSFRSFNNLISQNQLQKFQDSIKE